MIDEVQLGPIPDSSIQELTEEHPVPTKKCGRCQRMLPLHEFGPNRANRTHGLQCYCKQCCKDNRLSWYWNLPDRLAWRRARIKKEQVAADQRRRQQRYWQLRLEMIEAYGGCCSCCRETNPEFLTLEHLRGGGRADIRKFHKAPCLYRDLKRRGWPQDDYTCLCFNCNSAKGHFGVCPHERDRAKIA